MATLANRDRNSIPQPRATQQFSQMPPAENNNSEELEIMIEMTS